MKQNAGFNLMFRSKWSKVISICFGAGLLFFLGLLAFRLITGRSLGIRSFIFGKITYSVEFGRAVSDSHQVRTYSNGDFTNIIFIHQSVGYNLIKQGMLREKFLEAGFNFFDHGSNYGGLTNPEGKLLNYSYHIPEDNTDPDGYFKIFNQRLFGLPVNAFSGIMQHEVIIFKSCFPVSNITSDKQLELYRSYYLEMRNVMDQHPDKIFIPMTPPPLNPLSTSKEAAIRAREFANWLKSEEYLAGHPNVFTLDFFDLLAEGNPESPEYSMLRFEYREGADSHPNHLANEDVAPIFVDFVHQAVQNYHDSE